MIHILNGDATAYVFRQSGIPGQAIIWREALAAGPAGGITHGRTTDFRHRRQWVMQHWGATEQDYIRKVETEFHRISSLGPAEEITLWFETDLFCQVNLMFLLNRILHLGQVQADRIFLCCPTEVPGRPNFKGFGELEPEELSNLWRTVTRPLSQDTIRQYASAWDLYQSPDPAPLISAVQEEARFTDPILMAALQAHIARFPSAFNGLNASETFLLRLLSEGAAPEQAVRQFLTRDRIYGWGDVQVMDMLPPLEAIMAAGAASDVLNGKANKYDYWKGVEWIGGVRDGGVVEF